MVLVATVEPCTNSAQSRSRAGSGRSIDVGQRHPALVEIGTHLLRLGGRDVHLDIDRVELEDLGQHRVLAAAAHQVADIDEVPAHQPVEGRADFRVA